MRGRGVILSPKKFISNPYAAISSPSPLIKSSKKVVDRNFSDLSEIEALQLRIALLSSEIETAKRENEHGDTEQNSVGDFSKNTDESSVLVNETCALSDVTLPKPTVVEDDDVEVSIPLNRSFSDAKNIHVSTKIESPKQTDMTVNTSTGTSNVNDADIITVSTDFTTPVKKKKSRHIYASPRSSVRTGTRNGKLVKKSYGEENRDSLEIGPPSYLDNKIFTHAEVQKYHRYLSDSVPTEDDYDYAAHSFAIKSPTIIQRDMLGVLERNQHIPTFILEKEFLSDADYFDPEVLAAGGEKKENKPALVQLLENFLFLTGLGGEKEKPSPSVLTEATYLNQDVPSDAVSFHSSEDFALRTHSILWWFGKKSSSKLPEKPMYKADILKQQKQVELLSDQVAKLQDQLADALKMLANQPRNEAIVKSPQVSAMIARPAHPLAAIFGNPGSSDSSRPPFKLNLNQARPLNPVKTSPKQPQSRGISLGDIMNVKLKPAQPLVSSTHSKTNNQGISLDVLKSVRLKPVSSSPLPCPELRPSHSQPGVLSLAQLKSVRLRKVADSSNTPRSPFKPKSSGPFAVSMADISSFKLRKNVTDIPRSPGGTPFKPKPKITSPEAHVNPAMALRMRLFGTPRGERLSNLSNHHSNSVLSLNEQFDMESKDRTSSDKSISEKVLDSVSSSVSSSSPESSQKNDSNQLTTNSDPSESDNPQKSELSTSTDGSDQNSPVWKTDVGDFSFV